VEPGVIGRIPFFAEKSIRRIVPIQSDKHANEMSLVETVSDRYIVRTLRRDETDMVVEYAVAAYAGGMGIAPKVHAFDLKSGTMILEWIKGEHQRTLDGDDMRVLAATLRKLHTMDTSALSVSLPRARLEESIEVDTTTVADAFEALAHFPRYDVLCHHDLNPLNLLWSDGDVQLIDFEYVRINDRCFDLAAVCVEFDFGDVDAQSFIETYLNGEIFKMEKLMAYKVLYGALCRQWEDRRGIGC
jgi:Ser/Thr protein kinase RdoA (MazF antagonist)